MMTQAFYTGISGLKTFSTGIDIVTDNIANISTPGFRGYNAEFSTIYDAALSGSSQGVVTSQVGIGTRIASSSLIEANGSLLLSDRSTDLALQGDGWFGVQREGKPEYTRDGTFGFDANDDLVTGDGYHVLGTMGKNINDQDVLTKVLDEVKLGASGAQEKLRFPKSLSYPPEATTEAKFIANLGSGKPGFETITVGAGVIDPNGTKNHLRLEFTKKTVQTPPGTQWDVKAQTQSLDGTIVYDTKFGEVKFNDRGALISSSLSTIDNNGAAVKMDLGSGYDGIVTIDIPVVSGSSIANGTPGGELRGYSINKNGEVIATFTNGMQSSVGRIAVYHFQNDQGLERLSGTRFQESANSGKALFYKDANGENVIGSEIVNFMVEGSNYDLTSGLTELIILQRAYDASSKSITTADQMMQKALDMDA